MKALRGLISVRRRRPSAVERLFEAADLCVVDVGARGAAPPELARLAPFSRLVAFEPAAEEAERLRRTLLDGAWRDVTVVDAAVSARTGEAFLHLTEHPGMSSLLSPDDAVAGRYWKAAAFRATETERVRTVTLDDAASTHAFGDACYLKLDTQGTELDILRSGPKLVRESVVGIYVETLFQPFYAAQSLFGDVDAHLRGLDFVLVEMRPWFMRAHGFAERTYSRRQPVWAHCLYLREPGGLQDERGLARYVALALAYEHFDLACAVAPRLDDALVPELRSEAAAATECKAAELSPEELTALLRASGPS